MVSLSEESDDFEKGNRDAHFLKLDQFRMMAQKKIDKYRLVTKTKTKQANKQTM